MVKIFKYIISLLVIVALLLVFHGYFAPENLEVERFIFNNAVISEKLGGIESVKAKKSTYVQEGVGHDGRVSSAYNIFRYVVVGRTNKANVSIRENVSTSSNTEKFVIEEVTIY